MAGTPANLFAGSISSFLVALYGVAEGDATPIGFTDGGGAVVIDASYEKQRTDQIIAAVKAYAQEVNIRVDITIAECTLVNLAMMLGQLSGSVASSVLSVGGGANGLPIPGEEPNYLVVYLNGRGPGAANATRKVTVHKCYSLGAVEIPLTNGKTSVKWSFEVMWDADQAEGQELFTITDASGDTTPPAAPSVVPLNDASGVAITDNVVWTFAEAINGADVTTDFFKLMKVEDHSMVAGALTLSASKLVVTLNPTASLTNNKEYIAMACAGIRDLAGNELAADFTSSFTTAAE